MPFAAVPLKRVLFRLHWIVGLCAGLVLAVVGFSGGLLGFEAQVLRALNPQLRIAAEWRNLQTPDRWIENARAAYPDRQALSVQWNGPDAAPSVRLAKGTGRGTDIAFDPYSGQDPGIARGTTFFKNVESVHRNLAAGPIGKQIVGASTALLIVLALSGVCLRWPRRARSISAWLRLDLRLKGRGFWWNLHAVAGTWLLVFYLVAALTGLWWSYDFYRGAVNRMAGVTTPLRRAPPPVAQVGAPPVSIDAAWASFRLDVPQATRATIALPATTDASLQVRYQTPASAHERAWNTLTLNRADGTVVGHELDVDQPRGRRFVSALFPLHSGSLLGMPGRILMSVASLLLPLFAITGIWLWVLRRRGEASRRAREEGRAQVPRAAPSRPHALGLPETG